MIIPFLNHYLSPHTITQSEIQFQISKDKGNIQILSQTKV